MDLFFAERILLKTNSLNCFGNSDF
jgi:hypothetical protein